jgi:hypothetical protein
MLSEGQVFVAISFSMGCRFGPIEASGSVIRDDNPKQG